LVRPHDLEILPQANGKTEEAKVIRIVGLGFEVRVELDLGNEKEIWAQLTREQAEQLDLREGQTVFVRPERTKVFSGPQAS
jgi:sulfate transport system ATP-binding protein